MYPTSPEWLWLPAGANALERALADEGLTVTTAVSAINTDPWTSF